MPLPGGWPTTRHRWCSSRWARTPPVPSCCSRSASAATASRAGDGEQALALVASEAPDVVLLDHELTHVDGMSVLDRLRADDELAAVPVIMLTHSSDPGLLVEALRHGAHDYLRTPFDPEELYARVMAALRVKRLHDALLDANHRLELQALTDELTGLANRRHGGRQLEREIALCVRHGRLLALARVDIDHFKVINDTLGHQAGDEVLAEVARRLAGAGRGGDELARWAATSSSRSCPTPIRPARCARPSACVRRSPRRRWRSRAGRARSRSPSVGRTGRETPRTTSWPVPTGRSTRRRTPGATRSGRSRRRLRASSPRGAPPGGPSRVRSPPPRRRRGRSADPQGARRRRRGASLCP